MSSVRNTATAANVDTIRIQNFVTDDGFQVITVACFSPDNKFVSGYEVSVHRSKAGEHVNIMIDNNVPNVTPGCDASDDNIETCAPQKSELHNLIGREDDS